MRADDLVLAPTGPFSMFGPATPSHAGSQKLASGEHAWTIGFQSPDGSTMVVDTTRDGFEWLHMAITAALGRDSQGGDRPVMTLKAGT
jgi:hypothetical protein